MKTVISYLWIYRSKPKLFTYSWAKIWAKRCMNLWGLLCIVLHRLRYTNSGAKLGTLSVIGKIKLNGPADRLVVGERSFIGSGVSMALHNFIIIGDRVVINDDVRILTASHDTHSSTWAMFSRPIKIENYAWVAIGSTILPGVTIGRGAVVGACAVVTQDVPDFTIVAGNPARKVGMRCEDLTYSPVDLCAPFEAWLGK